MDFLRLLSSEPLLIPRRNKRHYAKHKETARELIHEKLEQYNQYYNYTYHRVAIRNQRSRWGSCSDRGNLNFNYRIMFLPEHLVDYIVVHELCHLKEFNHSPSFWALVEETIPEYKKHRKELRNYLL